MVTLDNLTVSYRRHPALHHLSGNFARGSLTAVVGPNGAGKSSLLKSIAGLLPSSTGTVTVSTPRSRIAYLPQVAEIDRAFPIDVHDCVLLGAWGGVGAPSLQRVGQSLHTVGLEGFEHRPIGTLSSGQLQRVLFARLLVQDADLYLLDEPFSAIDSKTTATLVALLQAWRQQGHTVIVVLHDDTLVRRQFPQTLLIARELIAWGATADTLTTDRLQQARAMAEAWDDDAEMCQRDTAPHHGAFA